MLQLKKHNVLKSQQINLKKFSCFCGSFSVLEYVSAGKKPSKYNTGSKICRILSILSNIIKAYKMSSLSKSPKALNKSFFSFLK